MHEELLAELGGRVRDRTTNVAWIQWSALGSGAVSRRAATSVIDPEALVLASLGLVTHERQLAELLGWWGEVGAGLLSVQRVRNLAGSYPDVVRHRLREFAGYAWGAGGDHRWKVLSDGKPLKAPKGAGAGAGAGAGKAGSPTLGGPGPTLLRLRLGLGVGIKADVVAALLGRPGWWSVRELAEATGYTTRAVRRAGLELGRGGWVEASPAAPAEHRADPARWLPLLGLESPAPWRQWQPLFVFAAAVDGWVTAGDWRGSKLEAVEREARSLVDAHRSAFKWCGVPVPEPLSRPGAEYIRAFGAAVEAVLDRMMEMV